MASKSVGSLFVNIVAKTTKFDKGMKGARSNLKTFGASVVNMGKKLLAFGSILTGVAIGGMVVFARGQLEIIDKLAKSAKALDITTEALVGIQHAAELTAGVTGDKLVVAFKRMQKTISDASVAGGGLSTAVRALKQLGLSAENLKNLAPEDQFAAIADGLKNVGAQADKARIAQDVFGRSGGALLPTLKLGSQGLRDLAEDAKALGLTFSAGEAAKVEEFNDQVTRLSGLMGGLGRGFVIRVAPAAAEAIQGMVLLAQQWNSPEVKKARERGAVAGIYDAMFGPLNRAASRLSRSIVDPIGQSISTSQGATAAGGNQRYQQPFTAAQAERWLQQDAQANQKQLTAFEKLMEEFSKEMDVKMAIP